MGKKKGKKPPQAAKDPTATPGPSTPDLSTDPAATPSKPVERGQGDAVGMAQGFGRKKGGVHASVEPGAALAPYQEPPGPQRHRGPPGFQQPQQQGPRGYPQLQQGPRGSQGFQQPQQQGPRGPWRHQSPETQPRPAQQDSARQQSPQTQTTPPTSGMQTPQIRDRGSDSPGSVSSERSRQLDDSPTMVSINKGLADMSPAERSPPKANEMVIPRRSKATSCGTLGKRIKVDTNHLALDLSRLVPTIYHYDVNIDPDRPKRLIRLVLAAFARKHFPKHCAPFDGRKNLYSATPLPFGQAASGEVNVRDQERESDKEFKVAIKLVNKIDTTLLAKFTEGKTNIATAQTAVQALDIVLRNAATMRMTPVGKSFFTKPEGRVLDLGDGMECWLGFFQSAIMGWKPFVNIDVAHKGFPKEQDCVAAITDLFTDRYGKPTTNTNVELNNFQKDDFMKYIKELKVLYEIPGQPSSKRTYRVNGLAQCAARQSFEMDDGRKITVQQYYELFKRYKLQYPMMPCLDVGSPNREKKILIPSELCRLVGGQVVIKRMTEKQTTALIKIAATNTDDRKRKIMDAIRRVDFKSDPCLKEFGVKVNDQFERIDARILEPPKLKYKEASITPRQGVWRNGQFLEGKGLQRWTILGVDKYIREDDLRSFVGQLRKQAATMGMVIDAPQEPIFNVIQAREKAKLEEFMMRRKDLQLIFVVVQDQGDSYAKVKQAAELTVGVLTQCLKSRTLSRMNAATCGNILLKVNAKLNGVNHQFDPGNKPPCLKVPCMIVGADVTHPPPDQQNTPSVAAVCASHEPKAFKYNLQFRLQPPKTEIIEDLEEIMVTQLKFFYNVNKGQKPQKIIFYRDGVSEGEFGKVLNKEFQAIRRACARMQADYKPAITFLVVQKRHHTRFFPTCPADSDGKNMNVPAGTIVDTIITHPTDLDFYLVSHASIQGVSRPTKYRRLWDDSNMSEDELEQLTYYLCHMFTRCTRSVSYPAPTYYAHLAAFRARCYLDGMRITMTDLPREQRERTIKAEIINNSPMFFV